VNLSVHPKAVQVLESAGLKVITEYVEDLTAYMPQ
jgi:hypothetical protein